MDNSKSGNRLIKQVAVLGSGVMGSRIAALFASVGIPVLLLDRLNPEVADKKDATKAEKNKIVNDALKAALQSNPSPVYTSKAAELISTGNFTDDIQRISNADWTIEVVVENLDIKKQIFTEVEKYRKAGTLITSNTSGIPIHLLAEGRSADFKANFAGSHFFNPPRYLRLLEIIPTPDTDRSVTDFLMQFGDKVLGKKTVQAKDTPAFIANRIGVYSMMSIIKIMEEQNLTIDEIEALTGPAIGRPKSATFRTADVVGIDTLAKVAQGVYDNCPNDEDRDVFIVPDWMKQMIKNGWLGDKTGQGFFKKTKNEKGETEILVIDLKTFEYVPRTKPKFASVEAAKNIESLTDRLKFLYNADDKAGTFYKAFHKKLFAYASNRIPEISDQVFSIDDSMKAGFGWEIGVFDSWDAIGFTNIMAQLKADSIKPAAWTNDMLEKDVLRFYDVDSNGNALCYSPLRKQYIAPVEITDVNYKPYIAMKNYVGRQVWSNKACRTYDMGDGVLGLEWFTKMGSIGGEVLEGIQKSISLAEQNYKGLVIANSGLNFSAGANVAMIFMLAIEQDFDEIDMAIRTFQQTVMRVRYSGIPVVIAPNGLALGGACELSMHADKVVAAAETYTGLVEAGIGVIPGGAGTKEFVLRASDEVHHNEPEIIPLQSRFITIATAKVSTSAFEAYNLGIYNAKDEVSVNQEARITKAKNAVITMFNNGYVQPVQRNDIKVLGRTALGALYSGIHGMYESKYATPHDVTVSKKLAYVMCGGDLSEPTLVNEQYLLDLEREAFLSLCGDKKTLERMQSLLKTGKPLRN